MAAKSLTVSNYPQLQQIHVSRNLAWFLQNYLRPAGFLTQALTIFADFAGSMAREAFKVNH